MKSKPELTSQPQVGSSELLGCDLITAERRRQIEQGGWSAGHDDGHSLGEISEAAACYTVVASATARGSSAKEWPADLLDGFHDSLVQWPWDKDYWKPSDDPIRNLVKAGALIAAEIDRIHRLRKNLRIGGGAKHPNVGMNDRP